LVKGGRLLSEIDSVKYLFHNSHRGAWSIHERWFA